MQLILISGMAGAGKSTALKILEDSGYLCVDNLPPPLLVQLIYTYIKLPDVKKIAVSVDSRSHYNLNELQDIIRNLDMLHVQTKIIFLDARLDILIARFSETRRRHPLADGKNTINDCINAERQILAEISTISHHIDTSDLTPNTLRNIVKEFVNADYSQLSVVIQSFGFKYGLPIDSDFVFDVRCLPNPYYDPKIRIFDGTNPQIIEFLSKQEKVTVMIEDIYKMLHPWIHEFSRDNRHYVTVSIGCTGGQHRSVYIAEQIAAYIAKNGYKTILRHRNISTPQLSQ